MPSEEDIITVKAEMPVSESFGIADELRGSTSGRAFLGNTVQPLGICSRTDAGRNHKEDS